jgi:hypothetical protein
MNDEFAIANHAHVLVWTDTKGDRRVTVVAEIPSTRTLKVPTVVFLC